MPAVADTTETPTVAPAKVYKQLSLADLKTFEHHDQSRSTDSAQEISERIKEETGLEKPRKISPAKCRKLQKSFEQGKASKYSTQELLDAGVFKFRPIGNLHPNALTNDEDISIHKRDGKEMQKLRQKSRFHPPASDPAEGKTKPEESIAGSIK